MIEKKEYGGKVYRKVYGEDKKVQCRKCCFSTHAGRFSDCTSPDNFHGCYTKGFHWVEVKIYPSVRLRSLEAKLRTAEKKLEVLRQNRPGGNKGDRACRTYMERFFSQQSKVERLRDEVKDAESKCSKRRKNHD